MAIAQAKYMAVHAKCSGKPNPWLLYKHAKYSGKPNSWLLYKQLYILNLIKVLKQLPLGSFLQHYFKCG